jgi:hypothetical protein
MRWLVTSFVIVGVIVLALLLVVGTNLNAIIETQIEEHGSRVTGTRVAVGGVDVAVREGRGSVVGIEIANPEGFSRKDVFALGEITIDIDPGSVLDSPMVLDAIVIGAPEVHFEMDAAARSNIDALLDNLEKSSRETASDSADDPGGAEPIRLRVERFSFSDGRITGDMSALGGETFELAMPSLSLEDVGGKAGATPAELGQQVVRAYASAVARRVARDQAKRGVEKALGEEAGALGEAAGGLLDRLAR